MKKTLFALVLFFFGGLNLLAFAEEYDSWVYRPISQYVSQEGWEDIQEELRQKRIQRQQQERVFSQGKMITIDTRDKASCEKIQKKLAQYQALENSRDALRDICVPKKDSPYVSVMMMDKGIRHKISFDNLDPKQKEILRQTRNFVGVGVGAVGLLWLLPESVTKWDKENIKEEGLTQKWKENVTEGPVMDEDEWAINYIGHPVSGAAYYVVARHAGLTRWESFGYSVFMSTFVWEYGVEAFAETPSIQDLFSTPIIGAVLGEYMYQLDQKIERNDGKLFNSRYLGGFVSAIMNPAGGVLNGINSLFNSRVIKSADTYIFSRPLKSFYGTNLPAGMENRANESVIGLDFEWKF
ncbi:MAG: DUF3943 domain-containing protein [Bacteriovoracaceae bacterium]|nr:DUF3943 domain-containing protein [Bacteriovoracaceae bacterium]